MLEGFLIGFHLQETRRHSSRAISRASRQISRAERTEQPSSISTACIWPSVSSRRCRNAGSG